MPNKNRMFYDPTSAPTSRVSDGRGSVANIAKIICNSGLDKGSIG